MTFDGHSGYHESWPGVVTPVCNHGLPPSQESVWTINSACRIAGVSSWTNGVSSTVRAGPGGVHSALALCQLPDYFTWSSTKKQQV